MKKDEIKKKISSLVLSQLPSYVKNDLDPLSSSFDHSRFASFVENYYKWLETSHATRIQDYQKVSINTVKNDSILTIRDETGNVYNSLIRLKSLKDIDETIVGFLKNFRSEFMSGIMYETASDPRKNVKLMKQFYESKGNEQSYHFLFRMLYNKAIQITYPIEETVFPSGGEYTKRRFVRAIATSPTATSNLSTLIGKFIVGETSGAKGVVSSIKENVISNTSNTITIQEMDFLEDSIVGTFSADEYFRGQDSGGNWIYLADGTTHLRGQLKSGISGVTFTVNADVVGGQGYYPYDDITVSTSTGWNVGWSIGDLEKTTVGKVQIENAGSGYATSDSIRFANSFLDIYQLSPNYATPPSNGTLAVEDIITGGTSGATAIIRKVDNNKIWIDDIEGVFVTDHTSDIGYGSEVFTANGDTFRVKRQYDACDQTAIARITSVDSTGIQDIEIIDGGVNYTFPPYVYTPGNTTGELNALGPIGNPIGSIGNIKIYEPGINYSTSDSLEFTLKSPPYTRAAAELTLGSLISDDAYLDMTNTLDGVHKIRDNKYYQEYSYLIDVNVMVETWSKVIENMVHPAGLKYWGRYEVHSDPPF